MTGELTGRKSNKGAFRTFALVGEPPVNVNNLPKGVTLQDVEKALSFQKKTILLDHFIATAKYFTRISTLLDRCIQKAEDHAENRYHLIKEECIDDWECFLLEKYKRHCGRLEEKLKSCCRHLRQDKVSLDVPKGLRNRIKKQMKYSTHKEALDKFNGYP